MVPTVVWDGDAVVMIDQRLLPAQELYLRCCTPHEVAVAIKDMAIRGAPAIGVAAAMAIALGVRLSTAEGAPLWAEFDAMCDELRATRPTAVNLFWAIDRMKRRFDDVATLGGEAMREAMIREAQAIHTEDLDA